LRLKKIRNPDICDARGHMGSVARVAVPHLVPADKYTGDGLSRACKTVFSSCLAIYHARAHDR
jgi:hypothetical protein